ncbi:MAG: FAD-dependent oxidoreductase [Methanoregula sp.]|nr:MAG: FAD-dependent oxidoreductase [Methanoregula sp.]
MTTAILGGGLSGLTLARLLHERGDDVIVLEAEQKSGGLCRSVQENGFTFDTGGSHIIFSRDEEVLGFMRRMIAGNEERNNRNTRIFYKGRYVKYPFENGLSDLPPEDRFFCINEFVKAQIAFETGSMPHPSNFKEWIYYTFGRGIAECYMVPYNEKIWKYPTDRMSQHWVDGRIPRPPVEDVIKSAIGIPTEGYSHQAVFSYPLDGGIEALIHAIAGPIENRIRTGFFVNSIRKNGSRFTISDGSNVVKADRCISTIPVQHLLPCLSNVPLDVRQACSDLVYNSLVCIALEVKGEVPPISWLYVPEITLGRTNRISFPSTYSPHAAPEGCSSILAEITHQSGDEVSHIPDADLILEVTETLEKMGIITKDRIIRSHVMRQPFAYVVYDLDYQKNIRIVKDYCMSAGIPLVGRFAEFEYLNMDGCIRRVIDFIKESPAT